MERVPGVLLRRMRSELQIGENRPVSRVELYDTRNLDQPPMQLNKTITIDFDKRSDSGASECMITMENFWGRRSPDYDANKFKTQGLILPRSGYFKKNFPFNMIKVYLGYGDLMTKCFTGYIDKVNISSDSNLITITARDAWGRLIDKVIEPLIEGETDVFVTYKEYSNMYVTAIIADLVSEALKAPFGDGSYDGYCIIDNIFESIDIYDAPYLSANKLATLVKKENYTILESGKEWTKVSYIKPDKTTIIGFIYNQYNLVDELFVENVKFEIGQTYEECVKQMMAAINFVGFGTRDGNIRCMHETQYSDTDNPHHYFDDRININQNDYNIDSTIIRDRIIVAGSENAPDWSLFECPSLTTYLNGFKRTMKVDVFWAKKINMRRTIAKSYFMQMFRKVRRITSGVVGNPSIDLYDLVKMNEVVSTAAMKYKIIGVRTTFSDSGYFDIVDMDIITEDIIVNKLDVTYTGQDLIKVKFDDSIILAPEKTMSFGYAINKNIKMSLIIIKVIDLSTGEIKTTINLNPDNSFTTDLALQSWEIERMDSVWASDPSNLAKIKSALFNGVVLTKFRYVQKAHKFEFEIQNLAKYIFPPSTENLKPQFKLEIEVQ